MRVVVEIGEYAGYVAVLAERSQRRQAVHTDRKIARAVVNMDLGADFVLHPDVRIEVVVVIDVPVQADFPCRSLAISTLEHVDDGRRIAGLIFEFSI